jgi:hypothetical protein
MQSPFAKALLESYRLAQEDPATTSVDPVSDMPDTLTPPEGGPTPPPLAPVFLYSWLGAHLALGFLGYKAYDYDINGNADLLYEVVAAIAELFGATLTRDDFDADYFVDEFYDQPHVKGFSRSRLAGYISAGLSLAGTAATFLAPSKIVQYTAFGTTLTSTFVLVQSFLASGWYDALIDPTDTDTDTLEEVDPFFAKARNYLLVGGLAGFATDALVLAKLFLLKPAEAPEPELLPPTDETGAPVELSLW